jgi:hypothetical protein
MNKILNYLYFKYGPMRLIIYILILNPDALDYEY